MLTQDIVKSKLKYDLETGVFTRWVEKHKRFDIAGGQQQNGYIYIKINNILYKAHRIAWLYVYGVLPDADIDHINQIKNDNRLCNLRCVTRSENQLNRGKRKDNTSCFTGIVFHKASSKWAANISKNKKRIHLGLFDSKQDAIEKRKHYEKLLYPLIKGD